MKDRRSAVDRIRPEYVEQTEQAARLEAERIETRIRVVEIERIETKLRALERAKTTKAEPPSDMSFTDKAGCPITVRTWESGQQAFIRAYDTSKVPVPEQVNIGQAGYANATLERSMDGQMRVRLNDLVTPPEYRGVGVGGQMLSQVEQYGRRHGASEIYGQIDSQEARDFWARQADHGWSIVPGKGLYGEVHYKLR
jgi:GNAT superfamily N-acetyltransferase